MYALLDRADVKTVSLQVFDYRFAVMDFDTEKKTPGFIPFFYLPQYAGCIKLASPYFVSLAPFCVGLFLSRKSGLALQVGSETAGLFISIGETYNFTLSNDQSQSCKIHFCMVEETGAATLNCCWRD